MRGWIIAPSGLIEPVPAPEIYVDGIGAIEAVGGGDLRYYLVQEQLPIEGELHVLQKVVVAKIIAPHANVPFHIAQLAQCIAPDISVAPSGKPRLVT